MQNQDNRFHSLVEKGENHFTKREYIDALNAWKQAVAIMPDSASLYHQIGLTYLRLSDLRQAEVAFKKTIRLKPDALDARGNLAKIQLISFDLAEAEKNINHLLAAAPDNPETHILYGNLLFLKNRFGVAEEAYRKALQLGPKSGRAFLKLATCCLARGNTAEADKLYKVATSFESKIPETFIEMGNHCRLRGDLRKAEEHFARAAYLEPENLAYQKRLAEFFSDTERYDVALEILRKVLNKTPDNQTVKKAVIEIFLTLNRLEEAHAMLDELSKSVTKDVEVNLLKGKYYLLQRQTVYAVSSFQTVVEAEPNLPLGHYLLGLAYLAGNHIRLSQKSFLHALTLDPYFSEADLALADIYYKKEEYELSLEHAKRVADREPENYRAHLILGNILLRQGKYDSALKRLQAAQKIHPESVSPLYYMAIASELSNRLEDALKLYQKVLALNRNLADVALGYVRLLAQVRRTKQAEEFCLDGIKAAPKNGYLYHILGEVYLLENKKDKALLSFKKAVVLNPQMTSSYVWFGRIYEEKKELDNQITLYETALQTIPDFLEAYKKLATLYLQKGNPEKAIATYETALAKNPDSALIANNLAWLYLENNKDLNKALSLAQSAYERLPDDPYVADTLGWAYYKKNLLTRAAWLLTAASSCMPENPLIQYHLGMTYYRNNENDASRSCLEKALALKLESPYREQATELLATLGVNNISNSITQ